MTYSDSIVRGRSGVRIQTNPTVRVLLPTLILTGFGLVMVYSASSLIASEKFNSHLYFFKRQTVFALIGILAMTFCRFFPLTKLKQLVYPLLLTALVFLIMVKIPGLGYSAGGATRWIKLGPFTFQPVEYVRLALVVYLAYSLSKKQDKLHRFSVGFLPHIIVLIVFLFLIMIQPDFGSAMILCALTWTMMFVAGVRLKHLFVSMVVLMPMAVVFLRMANYRIQRIISFIDPWKYSNDGGYQIVHSLMAFGRGGFFGSGLGGSYQKLYFLPEPHTDFIFSVIGEEFGLLGVILVVCLYGVILIEGTKIAMKAHDTFYQFLAIGLTTAIGLQVCINMGVTIGLLPTKGLTLPFISYGGTSLIMSMAMIGILLNVAAVEPE